jgi:FMN phosphatase YigB (HAD superfamily)
MNQTSHFKIIFFDYADTLFDSRSAIKPSQLVQLLQQKGQNLDLQTAQTFIKKINHAADTEQGRQIRKNSDISAQNHYQAWQQVALSVPGVNPDFADCFYTCFSDNRNWQPFSDTKTILQTLHQQRLKIAIISNIAWDIRPAFITADLDKYIDKYFLSYELGYEKPHQKIFKIAAQSYPHLPTSEMLMVGDNHNADGAASKMGIHTYILPPVSHLASDHRHLATVLNLVGLKKNLILNHKTHLWSIKRSFYFHNPGLIPF